PISWGSFFFSSSVPQVSSQDETSLAPIKENSYKPLLNASLFGIYMPNDLNSVKKSMLDVTLVGILFANNLEDSQVIIKAANGDELNYKLGDSIPGDATIKKITANGVLVERNGILESLSLPKNALTFEPAAEPLEEE
ncbi:MAG: general secretion pathway protein GspC, partial [Legionella sp.]